MLDYFMAGVGAGDLQFLLASAFIAGCARGFSGFGGALIFVPLASTVIAPTLAVPLLVVVDLALTPGMIPNAWRHAQRRNVAWMACGAVVGVPLGTLLLTRVDAVTIRWAIVILVVLLLALLMSGWRYRGGPNRPLTIAVGLASGVCSGTAQVGGPPVVAYWLGQTIPPRTVRANIVLYFAISSCISLASYLAGGLITTDALLLSVLIGPAFAVGLYLGTRLFGRAEERLFRRICYVLIAGAAVLGLPALDGVLR